MKPGTQVLARRKNIRHRRRYKYKRYENKKIGGPFWGLIRSITPNRDGELTTTKASVAPPGVGVRRQRCNGDVERSERGGMQVMAPRQKQCAGIRMEHGALGVPVLI